MMNQKAATPAKRQKAQEQAELKKENKRLEEENLRLRMENDYFKNLLIIRQRQRRDHNIS